jgi:hypothetical protein
LFNKGIYETSLTDETAERLFSNITDIGAPDKSFLAALRALLHKRLPRNEAVRLWCDKVYVTANDIAAMTVSENMNRFIPEIVRYSNSTEHNICIVYTLYQDAGEKMFEIVRANAGKGKRYLAGYTIREDLKVFYARKVNALFYTDDSNRNTVIFTAQLELKQFHALQMMLPKYLPRLFADSPLTGKELAFLKSAGNKSAVEYETLISEVVKSLDIRSEIIRTKLAGFETAFEQVKINEVWDEIKRYQTDYDGCIDRLRELSLTIQNRKYTLAGLECAVNKNSGDSELMEYFMCNKNLSVIMVSGTTLEFVSHGYADIYDEDAFSRYAGNHSGYMYKNINPDVTKPQMERLYRAVFEYGKYRLRLCAAYSVDMKTGLKPFRSYIFPSESKTYFPNPHIQKFGCIGSYASRFCEYMKKRDYVGAIDQAVVSGRNLNFYDSAVISDFAKDLSRTSIKCVEKSNGTLLTPLEAIKELEANNE